MKLDEIKADDFKTALQDPAQGRLIPGLEKLRPLLADAGYTMGKPSLRKSRKKDMGRILSYPLVGSLKKGKDPQEIVDSVFPVKKFSTTIVRMGKQILLQIYIDRPGDRFADTSEEDYRKYHMDPKTNATKPGVEQGYVTLRPDSRLSVSNGALKVNGRPYVVEIPEGHLSSVKDGKLVVLHKGEYKEYSPSEIKGYWA